MKYETSLRISRVILVICFMVFIGACNGDKPPVENPLKEEDTEKMDTGIYWTTTVGEIRRANLDGSNIKTLLTGLGDIWGLALDVSSSKMYWIEEGLNEGYQIRCANLDGSNIKNLVVSEEQGTHLALDVSGGKMYWIIDSRIVRANLDGSNIETLVDLELEEVFWYPSGLALDVSGGKMYWTSRRTGVIARANLDGSNIEALLVDLDGPGYLTLDVSGGKMYWIDHGELEGNVIDNKVVGLIIVRANLDGSNIETLRPARVGSDPISIALDVSGDKMYWTDEATHEIFRANLDGSNAITLNGEKGIFGSDLRFIALDVSGGS